MKCAVKTNFGSISWYYSWNALSKMNFILDMSCLKTNCVSICSWHELPKNKFRVDFIHGMRCLKQISCRFSKFCLEKRSLKLILRRFSKFCHEQRLLKQKFVFVDQIERNLRLRQGISRILRIRRYDTSCRIFKIPKVVYRNDASWSVWFEFNRRRSLQHRFSKTFSTRKHDRHRTSSRIQSNRSTVRRRREIHAMDRAPRWNSCSTRIQRRRKTNRQLQSRRLLRRNKYVLRIQRMLVSRKKFAFSCLKLPSYIFLFFQLARLLKVQRQSKTANGRLALQRRRSVPTYVEA